MKNQKGITLIALIITIIVMLILVAVTLTIALGDNGILQKARSASSNETLEQERETLLNLVMGAYDNNNEVQYDVLKESLPEGWSQDEEDETKHKSPNNNIFIVSSNGTITVEENNSGNNGGVGTVPATYIEVAGLPENVESLSYDSISEELKVAANEGKVIAVIKEGTDIAPIPNGFTVSTATGENTISEGLVIYEGTEKIDDSNVATAKTTRNQFVWIPVPDITKMAKLQSGNVENYEGVLYNFSGTTSTEQTNYGVTTTSYREPAILSSCDNASNGITEELMKTTFNTMVASVIKYGGFYVGRYETTNMNGDKITVKSGLTTGINSQTWYTMYTKSKTLSTEYVKSEMIWGCEWNAMLNWMLTGNDATKVTAKTNGNHSGSLKIKNTGATSTDVINNIYDLEGNVREWTQEANDTSYRVCRGGSYFSSTSPASRGSSSPTYSLNDDLGSRATLYIK